jgi:hypothetical protein
VAQGQQFLSRINSLTKDIGIDSMFALHGPERLAYYQKFGRALEVAQRAGFKEGNLAIRLLDVGAVLTTGKMLFSGDKEQQIKGLKYGATYYLGMAGLARMLANPTMADALIKGLRFGFKTREGVAAMGRLVVYLRQQGAKQVPKKMSPEEFGTMMRDMKQSNAQPQQ